MPRKPRGGKTGRPKGRRGFCGRCGLEGHYSNACHIEDPGEPTWEEIQAQLILPDTQGRSSLVDSRKYLARVLTSLERPSIRLAYPINCDPSTSPEKKRIAIRATANE